MIPIGDFCILIEKGSSLLALPIRIDKCGSYGSNCLNEDKWKTKTRILDMKKRSQL